jgi:hypothetical protein
MTTETQRQGRDSNQILIWVVVAIVVLAVIYFTL